MSDGDTLSIREACELLGRVGDFGRVSPTEMRRLRRQLTSAERRDGRRYLFGGGVRGAKCRTTRWALIDAGLLPDRGGRVHDVDISAITQGVGERVAELTDDVSQTRERIDQVAVNLQNLARAVMAHEKTLQSVRRRLDLP